MLAERILETPPANGRPAVQGQAPSDAADRMTDPQRRYLFRLLASLGVEGKQAEQHLKDYFKVARLVDVSRQAR
jgi:hypothetical protein